MDLTEWMRAQGPTCTRVSSPGQRVGRDRQVARLWAWAVQAGMPAVRVEAEVGSR